jgi:hypothetical protein
MMHVGALSALDGRFCAQFAGNEKATMVFISRLSILL